MKYSPEVYAGALIALAALRDKATERETGTIDFIAEAIAEKGDRDKLLSAPAADVAPVVHCRECKYDKQCCRIIRNNGHEPDDYCSFGELMDGKDEDNGT
jgi:hypothetical protein